MTSATEQHRNDVYRCMPGWVVSYDEGQETATIQPGTNDVRQDLDTGETISEPFDSIPGVPVAWPRFAGLVLKGTLEKYDPVLLLAFDLDPTPWRKAGRSNKPVDPVDVRRHGGGYWLALPTDLTLARKPSGT